MTTIQRLIDEHEALLALAERLEASVCGPVVNAGEAIMLKMLLAVDLAEHLASEDAELYGPMIASGDARTIGPAGTLQRELEQLREDWSAYLTEWSDDSIEQDWERFAAETRMLMQRLQARIARENGHLIPLALQRSTLRLRAA